MAAKAGGSVRQSARNSIEYNKDAKKQSQILGSIATATAKTSETKFRGFDSQNEDDDKETEHPYK